MADKMNSYRPVERLGGLLSNERKLIYLIIFLALVNGVIVLTLPLGIQAILNFIMGGRVSSSWIILIIVVMIGLIVSGIIQIGQLTLTEKLQQRIFAKSSFEFAVRIPRIKLEAIKNRYAPELMNQFFDTINLQKGVAKLLVDLPTATLQIVFGLVLISVYHPAFFFFSLGVIFLLYLLFKFTGPQGVATAYQESSNKYKVAHWLEELARTRSTFKLAGITDLPIKKVDQLILGYLHFRRRHFAILIRQYGSMVAFKAFTIVVMLITGSILLIENEISLGQFVAVEIIIILIMNSIEKIIISLETVYDVLTAVEKLGAISDLELESEEGNDRLYQDHAHGFTIDITNLNFKYPGGDRTVINDLSMRITPGEKIALVGSFGSGKSTLLQLLTGVYEAYDGKITFNGIHLRALQKAYLRCCIGDNIWQESIFNASLRDNVTIGKDTIDDEAVYEALKMVSATGEINFLQKGLDTELSPEGTMLPRSLARKLLLARSIVSNPNLLLLELDTNFLLSGEQKRFYDFIFEKDWTVIATTRETAYLERADKIVYLDAGSMVFSGDYESFKLSEYAQYIK